MTKIIIAALATTLFSLSSFAAVTATTASNSSKADLDAEVKDAKMRADSGSKSKLSASMTATYSGASVTQPFGEERPQIGRSSTEDPVSMGGGFGARYRFNKNESLYFATGFYKNLKDEDSKMDVSNPYLSYNNTFGVEDMQIGSSAKVSVTTQELEKKVGMVGTFSGSTSVLTKLNQSGLSGGVIAYAWYTHYRSGKEYDRYEKFSIDYGGSLGPMVDYRMSDKLNVYTQIKALTLTHVKAADSFDTRSSNITQSVGVGLALIRDFYFSPYVSFDWTEFSARKTAVNLHASINVF
jgi:hypothetical protein